MPGRLATTPPERLAVFRILVGLYAVGWLLARLPAHLHRAPIGFHAVGVLWWLGSPPDRIGSVLAIATPVVGIAFVAGWRYRVTAPLFAAGLLVLATLDSSWGEVFHTDDLMVLHTLLVAFAPAADALSMDARRRARESGTTVPVDARRRARESGTTVPVDVVPAYGHEIHRNEVVGEQYGWPLLLAALVVVATYLMAGFAKVRIAGAGWMSGDTLRNLVADDNLRKAVLGDRYSPIGAHLAGHPAVFQVFAIATLAVELGAPLALLGRRARWLWAGAAWAFHIGVVAVMAVFFPYHLSGIAYAPFFELERLPGWFRRRSDGEHAVQQEVDRAGDGDGSGEANEVVGQPGWRHR